jgi:hypothetical protein
MALPILETQSYELTLPSADVKVKYRPFLVKEEKVLLQALESEDQKQIVNALKEIVSACTFGSLNVDDLPTFDLEFIFLQIRAKSVGEVAKLKVLCPDDKSYIERSGRFFRIALSHDSLENYFETNFALMQHHKYSLGELEDMIPWEREIYITLLVNYLKEEKEKRAREANK